MRYIMRETKKKRVEKRTRYSDGGNHSIKSPNPVQSSSHEFTWQSQTSVAIITAWCIYVYTYIYMCTPSWIRSSLIMYSFRDRIRLGVAIIVIYLFPMSVCNTACTKWRYAHTHSHSFCLFFIYIYHQYLVMRRLIFEASDFLILLDVYISQCYILLRIIKRIKKSKILRKYIYYEFSLWLIISFYDITLTSVLLYMKSQRGEHPRVSSDNENIQKWNENYSWILTIYF